MARIKDCVEISYRLSTGRSVESRIVLRDAAGAEGRKMRKQYSGKFQGKVFVRELTKNANLLPMILNEPKSKPLQRVHHYFQVVR